MEKTFDYLSMHLYEWCLTCWGVAIWHRIVERATIIYSSVLLFPNPWPSVSCYRGAIEVYHLQWEIIPKYLLQQYEVSKEGLIQCFVFCFVLWRFHVWYGQSFAVLVCFPDEIVCPVSLICVTVNWILSVPNSVFSLWAPVITSLSTDVFHQNWCCYSCVISYFLDSCKVSK